MPGAGIVIVLTEKCLRSKHFVNYSSLFSFSKDERERERERDRDRETETETETEKTKHRRY